MVSAVSRPPKPWSPVSVGATTIWVEDRGDPGFERTPVLLLPAGGADASMFDQLADQLASDRRVVRLDFPGSGRSPRPEAPVDLVELVAALLERLELPPALVVGVSMGGTVALDLAVERPDLVSGVVAMSCAGHDHLAAEGPAYAGVGVFQALASGDRDTAVQRYVDLWCTSRHTPDTDARVHRLVEANIDSMLLTLTGDLRLPTWPTSERLPSITAPVLLVYGEQDDPAILRSGQRLARAIPDARHVLLPGTDHFVPVRRPDETSELVHQAIAAAGG